MNTRVFILPFDLQLQNYYRTHFDMQKRYLECLKVASQFLQNGAEKSAYRHFEYQDNVRKSGHNNIDRVFFAF